MRNVGWMVLAAVMLAACSGTGGASPGGVSIDLDGTAWTLTEINGAAPTAETEVTLQFQQGQMLGSAGCNQYSTFYVIEGEVFGTMEVTTTKMACEPDAVMDLEYRYVEALGQIDRISADEDRLELRSKDGAVSLFFTRRAAEPTREPEPTGESLGLAGTQWQLVTMDGQPVIPGSPVTLIFGEDGPGGNSGCNSYGVQSAEIGEGTVQFGEIASTLMACADTALMDQEAAYLAALGSVTTYRIEGDRLDLGTADNPTLLAFTRLSE